MIILSKRRIILACVLLTIFTYMYAGAEMLRNEQNPDSVETVALPVNKKTIIIDAGHGKPDGRSNC